MRERFPGTVLNFRAHGLMQVTEALLQDGRQFLSGDDVGKRNGAIFRAMRRVGFELPPRRMVTLQADAERIAAALSAVFGPVAAAVLAAGGDVLSVQGETLVAVFRNPHASGAVSERFRLTPLRNGLFTPELQWQSRGKRRILQECKLDTPGPGDRAGRPYRGTAMRRRRRHRLPIGRLRPQRAASSAQGRRGARTPAASAGRQAFPH